jgi:hypothetical protein
VAQWGKFGAIEQQFRNKQLPGEEMTPLAMKT